MTINQRGLKDYCEFFDTRKTRVIVRDSSGAFVGNIDGPFVWVFLEPKDGSPENCLHLTIEEAEILRDALNTWIQKNTGENLEGDGK